MAARGEKRVGAQALHRRLPTAAHELQAQRRARCRDWLQCSSLLTGGRAALRQGTYRHGPPGALQRHNCFHRIDVLLQGVGFTSDKSGRALRLSSQPTDLAHAEVKTSI